MLNSLVFADLHLHAHKDRADRLQNCVDVLNWVFDTAAKHDCRYIFFLGDLFHERSKIDVLNYLRTFECFMKHMMNDAHDRDMYLLVGNHDMYHRERWDVNSIKPLSAIPRVHIIDKPTIMHLGGRRIDWLPHVDNPIRELDKLKKAHGGAGDLLFGHMAVHGVMLNLCYGTKSDVIVEYDNDMVPVDLNVFADWQKVKLGHYHGWQVMKNVEYIGSPLQLTFGEAFQQKHVQILDLETLQEKYIVNDFSPKHFIVSPQDVINECYDFNNSFVRLTISDVPKAEEIDLCKMLQKKYKLLGLDTKDRENKTEGDKTLIEDAQASLTDVVGMVKAWPKTHGIPTGMDESRLEATGLKCLEAPASEGTV